ncbi:ABC transporter ATP-binding protein [Mesorhizobium sp. 1B3]|uniref:ABC transporter ATP-binding protein n=1 Tax=Mesorhizobium sp. 1B3 TaxID=3243599 RepID=UPI003D968047
MSGPAAITAEGISWGPSAGRPIIENVGFDIPAGTVTAIVGPNGAGKSTLLRCLYRHHRPIAGTILLDGRDIWSVGARAVARKVAVVLQETPTDFPFTVREVVETGRTPHQAGPFSWKAPDRLKVEEALDRFELTALADRAFAFLSGGEKQRVMLARAIVQEPGLIILDEPTNHLDIRHQLEILRDLRRLDATVIATMHDLNLAAAIADGVLVLQGGKMLGFGPPDMVLTPELVRRAFEVETTVDRHPHDGRPRFSFHLPGRG